MREGKFFQNTKLKPAARLLRPSRGTGNQETMDSDDDVTMVHETGHNVGMPTTTHELLPPATPHQLFLPLALTRVPPVACLRCCLCDLRGARGALLRCHAPSTDSDRPPIPERSPSARRRTRASIASSTPSQRTIPKTTRSSASKAAQTAGVGCAAAHRRIEPRRRRPISPAA